MLIHPNLKLHVIEYHIQFLLLVSFLPLIYHHHLLLLQLPCSYGVNDMAESAEKIYAAAAGAPERHSVVLLAHNGPTGL
jgi:hypothetical protein